MLVFLLFFQVLYTLTNWKWVKTVLAIFFVLWVAEIVFCIGLVFTILPNLMNMLSELINML